MTLEELKKGEHVTVEYKLDIPQEREKYLKSAVAFANGAGGKLVFGVKNQTWDVIGFPDDELFQKYDAIANSIYDACTPSLVPVMEIEEVDGKKIIVANILPGMDKPYYLRADGMMDGTYTFRPGSYGKYSNDNSDAKGYMFSVMMTRSQWSEYTYMPYLKEVDPDHIPVGGEVGAVGEIDADHGVRQKTPPLRAAL
jgi:predicted HTH transcriptional regulator